MGSFLNPIGPLPPSVYWRRRIIVVGIPLALVALFAYSCSGSTAAPAAQSGAAGASATPTETSAIITPGATPTGSIPPPRSYPGAGPTGTVVPPGTGGATGGIAGAEGCVLSVSVRVDKSGQSTPPVYTSGQDVYFSVVMNNAGSANCRLDVSGKGVVLTVNPLGSTTTVWSSAACAKATDLRVLGPGEGYTETVRWQRQQAVNSCPTPAGQVPSGQYAVTAAVDGVTAASVQFVLQ